MISLAKFIPEIKIIPNTIQPRVGMVWKYTNDRDNFNPSYPQAEYHWIITKMHDDIFEYKNIKYITDNDDELYNTKFIKDFEESVKNKTIKIIR